MLSGNCTEALSIQANVTISCSSAKLIKNGIAPLPFPLPALLQLYWYVKREERVRVRGHAQFYATLGVIEIWNFSGAWDLVLGVSLSGGPKTEMRCGIGSFQNWTVASLFGLLCRV